MYMSEELTTVKGIGPKTAEKLVENGISTVEDLAVLRPDELKAILNITLKAAKDIINDAKRIALDTAIPAHTLDEIEKHQKEVVQRIPTGSSALDKILGGGVKTEAITLLKGPYASGKTQLCYQLVVNCIKYLGRKAIWIETESGTMVPDRLKEMAKTIGLKLNQEEDVIVIPAKAIKSPNAQFIAYQRAIKEMERRNLDVGIMVIDSFNGVFREYYSGREMLPDRAEELARHLGYLDQIASQYNMAIVLTGQIMDIPDPGSQLGERVKTGHTHRVYGGNLLNHWCTYIISLQKVSMTDWEAVVADAPDVPMTSCRFKIVSSGVRDV